jgi:hypothetical protein
VLLVSGRIDNEGDTMTKRIDGVDGNRQLAPAHAEAHALGLRFRREVCVVAT